MFILDPTFGFEPAVLTLQFISFSRSKNNSSYQFHVLEANTRTHRERLNDKRLIHDYQTTVDATNPNHRHLSDRLSVEEGPQILGPGVRYPGPPSRR